MTDEEVIVALGDVTRLAVSLDTTKSTVANWKERGIPWRFRPYVKEIARRRRIKLPSDFLTNQVKKEPQA